MKYSLQILLGLLFGYGVCHASSEGLVASYDFNEGEGSVIHDRSGNGNDGAVHGAQFVKWGDGYALKLNGVDNYVEFPSSKSLDLTEVITVEAWVRPESLPGFGEPGVVGKGYESYVITYYLDGNCWWYIGGGPNNCKAPVGLGAWHHVVGTYDGKSMKLYIDGILADRKPATGTRIPSGKEFFLGKSSGEVRYTQNAHYKGMIDEVRIYNRALSEAEVLQEYRTTNLTHAVEITPRVYPFSDEIALELSLRGLGELPQDAMVDIELLKPGGRRPLLSRRLRPVKSWQTLETALAATNLAPAAYVIQASAKDAKGRTIGKASVESVTWPKKPAWPSAAPGVRVLNNLVTELLNVVPASSQKEFTFTNPREGWVFVATTAEVDGDGELRLSLDPSIAGQVIIVHNGGRKTSQEAMRFLPAGKHTLGLQRNGKAALKHLVVRAVPELIYCQFPSNPIVKPFGPFDWKFLHKDVLRNCNCIIAHHDDAVRPNVEEWRKSGRKWILSCGLVGLDGSAVSADRAFESWSQHPGMQNPLYDGIIVDEFSGGNSDQYDGWTEGLRRVWRDPEFQGKSFYPWCGTMFAADKSKAFTQLVMDHGSKMAFERYLNERDSEVVARRHLESNLSEICRQWEEAQPGAIAHMIVTLGYFAAPNETLDINPSVDFKVFMDMEFRLLASDPTFYGLGGIMEYLSSYTDEETVRWAGKLYRHYGIEGKTDLLSKEHGFTYKLNHLQNPDFDEGTEGWTVEAAEKDSVTVKNMTGFAWLEGRYPPTSEGNNFLLMKRSGNKPNRVSQKIKGLQPGRLYALRMFVADYGDLTHGRSVKAEHPVSITLDGAEPIPSKCFAYVVDNCYSHHLPPFDDKHKAWLNYHFRVFRATGKEATLTFSDWASDQEPGGTIGQELMCNFIEVQPYLAD